MRQLLGVNSKQSLKFLSTITETREPEPYCASKISNMNFHYTISCWRFIYNFFWWKHWWGSSHWNKVLMINLNICFWCKVLQTKSNHLFFTEMARPVQGSNISLNVNLTVPQANFVSQVQLYNSSWFQSNQPTFLIMMVLKWTINKIVIAMHCLMLIYLCCRMVLTLQTLRRYWTRSSTCRAAPSPSTGRNPTIQQPLYRLGTFLFHVIIAFSVFCFCLWSIMYLKDQVNALYFAKVGNVQIRT